MTYGQAIITLKSLNSPDPTADMAEKFEAIKKITEMATINAVNKADLMRCVKWLLERLEAALDRLAAYKDTGMEPEDILSAADMGKVACALHELNRYKDLGDLGRLRELVEADRAGRCVVLPCNVDAIVWVTMAYGKQYNPPIEGRVKKFILHDDEIVYLEAIIRMDISDGKKEYGYSTNSFGKAVFLTREAAEAALKQNNE
ncbi:hypothetical protein ACTQ33_04085 [Candidatus Avoscillospira sp. LCP25S3_F1]|uniref:hypothetical protein n=1 Tax=Candidatus Avoscillospira sp. LCP25S3_F1 TaxID=3438825 RepID=UPI003F8E6CF3